VGTKQTPGPTTPRPLPSKEGNRVSVPSQFMAENKPTGRNPLTRPAPAEASAGCGPPSPPRGRATSSGIMREKTLAMLASALAGLLLSAGCSRSVIPAEPPPPKGIVDLDEAGWEKVRAQQHGRVLLVDFWATWCDPCREEFPNLVRLHNAYRSRGLSLVAISMDEPESVPAVQRFLQSQGADFGSYRQHFNDFEALVNSINPRWGGGIPATFLYDHEGRLVNSWEGATTYQEFENAVKPMLP